MKVVIPLLFLLSSLSLAQETVVLSGMVEDAGTHEGLASANIRVLGTSLGTVANAGGMYRLILSPGQRNIVASCLGYAPDTLHILLTGDETHTFRLTPSDIILPEVVVSSEDPAIGIIRRAIASKKRWMDRLGSFTMDGFTRQVLKRDTAIASIMESFTKGYWQQGDTLREIVKQKRQTENIKSEFNFASVGRILNFNEDEIRFVGYTFVGPTATDALDYYDYKLLRTRSGFGKEIYEIKMIPRRRTVPLFEGTVNIAGDTYALMGVDVRPNEAFSIPFVKVSALRYRQQFGLYESAFWMPADIRIDVAAKISVIGISFPPINFSQTSVITDYAINATIPDSIFQKPRLSVDTSSRMDQSYWETNAVLPLTLEEEHAYKTLDSTQTLDVQFRPGGIAFELGGGSGGPLSIIQALDFSFNRIEGVHLGVDVTLDSLSGTMEARAAVGYGLSNRRGTYKLGATFFSTPQRQLGVEGDVYRQMDHRPDAGYYGRLFNSVTSLFYRNDYNDYFETEGGRVFVAVRPVEKVAMALGFVAERQRSVTQRTDFSLFSRSRSYRANPAIADGRLRSLQFSVRIGEEAVPLGLVIPDALEASFEYSSPTLANSSFGFTRLTGSATISVPTFGRSYLFPPTLRVKLSAGTSSGSLPPQRLFSLESASSNVAIFGVFRAMEVKEFTGTRFIALNVEHNFRTLPFLALGIPFLYENNIELVVHGGLARTWGSPVYSSIPPITLTRVSTSGWYYESGIGLTRLFDLFRADFTWRLSAPTGFRFTVGVANIL